MSEKQFGEQLSQLMAAIDMCIKQQLITPALALLYTAIDIAGWLRYGNNIKEVGKRFTQWTDEYIFPYLDSRCSSSDIYGARCGILHTFSPDSSLSAKGKAKTVSYAWGSSDGSVLSEIIDMGQMKDEWVELKIEDLFEALIKGVCRMASEMEKDPDLKEEIHSRSKKFYCSMSDEEGKELLRQGKEILGI